MIIKAKNTALNNQIRRLYALTKIEVQIIHTFAYTWKFPRARAHTLIIMRSKLSFCSYEWK